MHNVQYMWTTLNRLSGGIFKKPMENVWIESAKNRFLWWPGGRLDLTRGGQCRSRESWKTTLESQGDLVKDRHSYSLKKGPLTLSQGKIKMGDDVVDDDDDDAVRTSLSQGWVERHFTEELFLRTQYTVSLFSHIRQVKMWGGKIWTVNKAQLVTSAGFHTS
jgi:hypothetical protein